MIINFNPAIWSAIVLSAGSIAVGIEPFKKLYLDKMLGKFNWYLDYRGIIIRGCAFAVALLMVLSSDSLSISGALSLAPMNTIAEIGDKIITATMLTFSEEFLHIIGDGILLWSSTKTTELRHKANQQANGDYNA